MKKSALILLATFISLFSFAQACLENGLLVTTQEQIDNFSEDYPDCTNVLGTLEIIGTGSNITSLEGLSQLESIQGSLNVHYSSGLENIIGLDNVQSIGGNLSIVSCHYMLDLTMDNLHFVGGDVSFGINAFMESVSFDELIEVSGDFGVGGANVVSLNVSSLSNVGQSFRVGATLITSLDIPELTSVGSRFNISGSEYLTSINAMNLNSVEGVKISGNTLLEVIYASIEESSYSDSFIIENNPLLTNINFLPNASNIEGSLKLVNTPIENLDMFANLVSVEGEFNIGLPTISNLSAFSNLTSVGGAVRISYNSSLENLNGLENINEVSGQFVINHNESLTSLHGIQNVHTVNGILCIAHNPNLADVNDLNMPNGDVTLELIDNPSLDDMGGFENIAQIGGWIQIYSMPLLENLNFLNNWNVSTGAGFEISGNTNLSNCNQAIICQLLEDPTSDINFINNSPGCNSNIEVEASCGIVGVEENNVIDYRIYPNPSNGFFNVISYDIETITVLNSLGKVVLNEAKFYNSTELNLSQFPDGMYVLVFRDKNGNQSFDRITKH